MTVLEQLRGTAPWNWPADAAACIKRGLDSDDEAMQLSSAGLAGDLMVMDDELAARLLALVLAGGSEKLRTTAAASLGPALEEAATVGFDAELDPEFDRPALGRERFEQVRRALRSTYEDPGQPEPLRRVCLEVSVRVPEPWHAGAVRAAFESADPAWRAAALRCMGWIGGFCAEILAGLEARDLELRRAAVPSAAMVELEAAGPRVLELARDANGDRELRLLSVEALGTLCPPGSLALLLQLSSCGDEPLSSIARQAISERRAFSVAPPS